MGIDLASDFIQRYIRITTTKPVPGMLGLAKNGDFYWLYYSGMGQTNYHKLSDMHQKIAESLIKEKSLKTTDETRILPVYGKHELIGEIVFNLVHRCSENANTMKSFEYSIQHLNFCQESEVAAHFKKYNSYKKNMFAIRNWKIIRLDWDKKRIAIAKKDKLTPYVIHSTYVQFEQSKRTNHELTKKRFKVGHFRLSSPIKDIFEPCVLETNNSIYVLLDVGEIIFDSDGLYS